MFLSAIELSFDDETAFFEKNTKTMAHSSHSLQDNNDYRRAESFHFG